jgi:hypothetical protein
VLNPPQYPLVIYQHKTAVAGQVIADALSAQIETLEEHRDDRWAQGLMAQQTVPKRAAGGGFRSARS